LNASLHITLVIDALKPGGSERVACEMANYWAEKGKRVTLVTFKDDLPFYGLHGKVHHLALGIATGSGNWMTGMVNSYRRIRTLRKELKKLAPDVVIGFFADINSLLVLVTKSLGIPVVLSERNHPVRHRIPLRWRWMRRLVYPLADGLVLQTPEAARYYRGYRLRKHVIPNPLRDIPQDEQYNKDEKSEPGEQGEYDNPDNPDNQGEMGQQDCGEKSQMILAVGRLTHQKGFDLLLKSYARSGLYPLWQLVIAGEGEERKNLEDLASRLGVREKVSFPGVVADIDCYYHQASMFVLSSRYEGFPNVLAEAMAAGVPCISFDCPYGPAHMIQNNETGLLVSAEDVQALGRSLYFLSAHPHLRRRMSQKASLAIREQLDQGKIMGQWEELIQSLGGREEKKV